MRFISFYQVCVLFICFLQFKPSCSEYIYNNTNYYYKNITDNNITVTKWEGSSENLLLGYPNVERIETSNYSYYNKGCVNNGEIRIVLHYGSMSISKMNDIITYNNVGERYLSAPGQFMYIEIQPNSAVFIIGSKYDLVDCLNDVSFYNNPHLDNNMVTRSYLMHNVDNIVHDGHLNNGTANATDYMWNSTLFTSPWTLIELYTPSAYVSLHEHPLSVIYILLEGCSISFCYNDNDNDCMIAIDGMVRYEKYGVIYRENISVMPGYSKCIFGVEEFYYNYDLGQPIFYNDYTDLDNTIPVTTPLRTITTL